MADEAPISLERRDVLLYVNSERVVRTLPPDARDAAIAGLRDHGEYTFPLLGTWSGHAGASSTTYDGGRFGNLPVVSLELPEWEQEALQAVWKLVRQQGRRLHVVDVGKESSLRRLITEHLHHLHDFPVLVRPDGRRLEGIKEFTPENLVRFLED
jgi:hypothetical protein